MSSKFLKNICEFLNWVHWTSFSIQNHLCAVLYFCAEGLEKDRLSAVPATLCWEMRAEMPTSNMETGSSTLFLPWRFSVVSVNPNHVLDCFFSRNSYFKCNSAPYIFLRDCSLFIRCWLSFYVPGSVLGFWGYKNKICVKNSLVFSQAAAWQALSTHLVGS